MGQYEEAVIILEKAREFNPKIVVLEPFLAVGYVYTGHVPEARALLNWRIKKGYDLPKFMAFWGLFKNPEVQKRFADAFLKAGVSGKPSGYYQISKYPKLTGKEIRKLILGHKITGFDFWNGKQWWLDPTKDGKAIYRNSVGTYNVKSWVEEDMFCKQGEKLYGGFKDGADVYKNPKGSLKKKDEYLLTTDYGIYPFSIVD